MSTHSILSIYANRILRTAKEWNHWSTRKRMCKRQATDGTEAATTYNISWRRRRYRRYQAMKRQHIHWVSRSSSSTIWTPSTSPTATHTHILIYSIISTKFAIQPPPKIDSRGRSWQEVLLEMRLICLSSPIWKVRKMILLRGLQWFWVQEYILVSRMLHS